MGLLIESEKYNCKKVTEKYQEALKSEKRLVQKLHLQLTTDAETGLPNSVVLHKELDGLLTATPHTKAVIFMALNDSFNMLKRTFSTKIPEWILYQTSLRLQKLMGDRGKIFHTHEDEFLLLLDEVREVDEVLAFAKKILDKVEKSHVMAGYTISLGVNLGIALYPEHGKKKSTLLRHADIALSEAVKNKTGFELFTPLLKDLIVERVELQNGILLALESQANPDERPQFELYFHPQIEVENWNTPDVKGRVVGAETLIRWKHPTLGFIPPSKFIPVAEDTGLIIPLGHWIIHSAVTHLMDLKRQGYDNLGISVNFSSLQFNYEDITLMTKDIVRRRGISPKSLKLEITESGFMKNFHQTAEKIQSLRQEGFKILLDDFGTGYSSLSYLKSLPIDVVKIDKSFVDGVTKDSSDQALTSAIITLAKNLNLGVIVEGTETRDQIDWLTEHGCQVFQGYYFSKPLPYADFVQFIKNFPKHFSEKSQISSWKK